MNNKLKKHILKELNKADKYLCKVFDYLYPLGEDNRKDLKLQKEIWHLCEAGELITRIIVELECLDNE